jgi:hypothetical protein
MRAKKTLNYKVLDTYETLHQRSQLKSPLERNNTPYGTNTRETCFFFLTQTTLDGVLDKDKIMDNVQKHNICTICVHCFPEENLGNTL